MKITYLDHSGFLVELDTHYLLFDYVKGILPPMENDKQLLVFVSHRHGDHFSPKIFELAEQTSKNGHFPGQVTYLLSDDISREQVPTQCRERVIWTGAYMEITVDDVRVKTWKSTDEGVAFSVCAEGTWIYHAGDLNHWYWKGEPEEWNCQMTKDYRAELEKIALWHRKSSEGVPDKEAGRELAVAFVPTDARLEEYFYLGLDDFMRTVGANTVFPMHFWGDYDVCRRVKELPCTAAYREQIMEIQKEGETFLV